jgi:hypothetical protein
MLFGQIDDRRIDGPVLLSNCFIGAAQMPSCAPFERPDGTLLCDLFIEVSNPEEDKMLS